MISEPLTRFVDDPTQPLRNALVDTLITAGDITSPQIAAAFRVVPRHVFAPEAPLEQAYRVTEAIRVKRDARGATISSVSAPYVQARMLAQAHLAPGMRCLEIGSGGYHAALMAELVGSAGQVTTVDIDADIVQRARQFLAAAG
ncbi:MAG TPA: methyltransferase, FxLD system, partial [Micromonospora sp.]